MEETIIIISNEGKELRVSSQIIEMSMLIKSIIEDNGLTESLFFDISSKQLIDVVRFCELNNFDPIKNLAKKVNSEDFRKYVDQENFDYFLDFKTIEEIICLLKASYQMDIDCLSKLCEIKIATMVFIDQTEKGILKAKKLGFTEYTVEEEDRILKKFPWAFQVETKYSH